MKESTIAVWGGEDAPHRLGRCTQGAVVPGVSFGYDDRVADLEQARAVLD